jgi:phospholipase C
MNGMHKLLLSTLLLTPAAAFCAPATPIKHLVIIFPENFSFDHYFGTYPRAANPPNGEGAINPFRLDRSQAATADQSHNYTPEQMAFHAGLMDLFPKSVGRGNKPNAGPHTPLSSSPTRRTARWICETEKTAWRMAARAHSG